MAGSLIKGGGGPGRVEEGFGLWLMLCGPRSCSPWPGLALSRECSEALGLNASGKKPHSGTKKPLSMDSLSESTQQMRPGLCKVRSFLGGSSRQDLDTWDDAEWFEDRGLDILDFKVKAVALCENRWDEVEGLQVMYSKRGRPDVTHTLPFRSICSNRDEATTTRTLDLEEGEYIVQVDQVVGGHGELASLRLTSSAGVEVKVGLERYFHQQERWELARGCGIAGFWGAVERGRRIFGLGGYVSRCLSLAWSRERHAACQESFRAAVRELLLVHRRDRKRYSGRTGSIGSLPEGVLMLVVAKLYELEKASPSIVWGKRRISHLFELHENNS